MERTITLIIALTLLTTSASGLIWLFLKMGSR
jgi:hypothetical protein